MNDTLVTGRFKLSNRDEMEVVVGKTVVENSSRGNCDVFTMSNEAKEKVMIGVNGMRPLYIPIDDWPKLKELVDEYVDKYKKVREPYKAS